MPDTKKRWDDLGLELISATPQQFSAMLAADYERYGKLIQRIGSGIAQ
jgi:tripartite-type tricarboxylate transporter receptor subunit TctC